MADEGVAEPTFALWASSLQSFGVLVSLGTFIVLVFTLVYIGRQVVLAWHQIEATYREMRAAVNVLQYQAIARGQDIYIRPSFREARENVFPRFDHEPPSVWDKKWTKEETKHGLEVCRNMNEIATLVVTRAVPLATFLNEWAVPFWKAWVLLQPLVQSERDRRDPTLWGDFEEAARRATASLEARGIVKGRQFVVRN